MRSGKKLLIPLTLCLILSACGPSASDAQKLGFESVEEMKSLQEKGFKTKAEFNEAEAKKQGDESTAARAYRNPRDAYQDAYQAVMNANEFDLELPEGLTREQYADQVATELVLRSYSPEDLAGSPFAGLTAPAAPAPTGGEGPTQTEADVLQSARAALAAGADEAAVRERLAALGIDPEKL